MAVNKAGATPVEAITHGDKRATIPTAQNQEWLPADGRGPIPLLYPRDPTLDPQLVWKGKDLQDAEDLVVEAPPLYIQEKLDPRVLIENLRRTAARPDAEPELALFDSFDGLEGMQSVEFYKHAANWSNRLILGDSLQVMASLAEREQLRGQVQMIYMDPPYGINFGSNWQVSTRATVVKDRLEDASREVEQIKAFRDTWEDGLHSYLPYLRDRMMASRDLLTESGSFFLQIGDENLHLARCLLDEVFGADNFCAQISFRTKIPLRTTLVPQVFDHVLWYARSRPAVKFRRLFTKRPTDETSQFGWLRLTDGTSRRKSRAEATGETALPRGARQFTMVDLVSAGRTESCVFEFSLFGRTFFPSSGKSWKTNPLGIERLIAANRLMAEGKVPRYVFYADDYPVSELSNVWTDTQGASGRQYVVQTATKVVQRCLLMTTDPGDLVLDPTCGAGTTAVVAEQWGRRWITIDTSRVAVTVARQRLMGSVFPYYVLADPSADSASSKDIRKGFVYRQVPHVTLGTISRDPRITPDMTQEAIDSLIRASAEKEILYDQPEESTDVVRVAGPFSVESLSPHRAFDDAAELPASQSHVDQVSTTSFEQMLLDNLRRAGVQNGRKAERFEFDEVERLPGKYLTARAVPSGDLAEQRVAVSIGPRYGTVGSDWIKAAAREAMRGQGHDVLLVLGFAFDPRALDTVNEFQADDGGEFSVQAEHQAGSIRILLVRMNVDLAMGETLLKKTKAANLFTVFGEPDVSAPEWTDAGWVVTIRGFDVYNPVTGEVRAGTEDDIAMWMVDTDYDEESFFVRHAYFLGTDPYDRLKRALKAEIDPEAWESLNSATSRPFPHPSTGKVAVKVVNHYGDELLTVLDLPSPPRG